MRNTIKFRFAGIGIMLAMYAVFAVAVMLLWNYLMPQIFGLMELNYLQSAGLLVLGRLLFGGLGGHHRRQGHPFHHDNKLREKWMTMSEDERKEFMEKEMHRRFSPLHGFGERAEQNRDNRNE